MSAWTTIAQAVAEKYGVEDELFVRDRIGKINEDRMNDRDITAKTFKSGQEAVQFGGKGVGGNAVARFGTDDDDDTASSQAASEFAAIINALKQNGLAEEVLLQDEFNFADLADASGAVFSRETIGSIADDVDFAFDVKETQSGEFLIQAGGAGVGGNAAVRFATMEEAQAFADLMNTLEAAGLQDELFL